MWLWMSMSEGGHVGEVKGLAHYGGLGFSSGDWACDGSYAGFGAEEGCSVCVCVCVCVHVTGLPWWRSGQEFAYQCRGHGFNPWSGKIPHAAEQLSPCAMTTEPVL